MVSWRFDRCELARACFVAAGLLAVTYLLPAGVAADSFTDQGEGGTLLPMQNDDVRMVSERVEFLLDGSESRVHAHYVFENLTNRALRFVMAFPVMAGDEEEEEVFEDEKPFDPLRGTFSAIVDGAPVAGRRVEHACVLGGKVCYDFVYRFAIRFAPKGRRVVDYEYPPGGWSDNTWDVEATGFILATGRLWAGTIGEIELIYRFLPAGGPPPGFVAFNLPDAERENYNGPDTGCSTLEADPSEPQRDSGERRVACAQTLRGERGTIMLWESGPAFEYTVACDSKTLVVTLQGRDVEPAGDVIAYTATSGDFGPYDGWCESGGTTAADASSTTSDAARDATVVDGPATTEGGALADAAVREQGPSPGSTEGQSVLLTLPDVQREAVAPIVHSSAPEAGRDGGTGPARTQESPRRGCTCSASGVGSPGDGSWTLLLVAILVRVLRRGATTPTPRGG
jgi:hypothetical protein